MSDGVLDSQGMMSMRADRESVCAGDDTDPHEGGFLADPGWTVLEMLAAARKACPLASISGGKATWLINVGGRDGLCIGVAAQQWTRPRLTIPDTTLAGALLQGQAPRLFFRYWCQADPDAVFRALAAGDALPPKY